MTAGTTAHDRPPVEEMYVVHRAFRAHLPGVAALVRSTPAGDLRRAAVVGDHLRLLLLGLELHHTGEDVELWPRLLERARPSAGLIATMQSQHETVHAIIEHARSLAGRWRTAPEAVLGEQLARAAESLCTSLFEHLDLEEREILPLAEAHITRAEWSRLGGSMKKARPVDTAVLVGVLLDVCDDEERRLMLAALPAPVRVLAGSLGGVLYRRHLRRLRVA
jgi:Hemerythrin HHE cation binding domain